MAFRITSDEIKASYLAVTASMSNWVFEDTQLTRSRTMSFLIAADSSSTADVAASAAAVAAAATSAAMSDFSSSEGGSSRWRRHLER